MKRMYELTPDELDNAVANVMADHDSSIRNMIEQLDLSNYTDTHLNYIGSENALFFKSLKRAFNSFGLNITADTRESNTIPNILDNDFVQNINGHKIPYIVENKFLQIDRQEPRSATSTSKCGYETRSNIGLAVYQIINQLTDWRDLAEMNVSIIGRGRVGMAVANLMIPVCGSTAIFTSKSNTFEHYIDILINTATPNEDKPLKYNDDQQFAGVLIDVGFSKSGKYDISKPRSDGYISPVQVGKVCTQLIVAETVEKWDRIISHSRLKGYE